MPRRAAGGKGRAATEGSEARPCGRVVGVASWVAARRDRPHYAAADRADLRAGPGFRADPKVFPGTRRVPDQGWGKPSGTGQEPGENPAKRRRG